MPCGATEVLCAPPHPGQIIQTLHTDEAGEIEEAHTGEWQPGPKSLQLLDGLVPERGKVGSWAQGCDPWDTGRRQAGLQGTQVWGTG